MRKKYFDGYWHRSDHRFLVSRFDVVLCSVQTIPLKYIYSTEMRCHLFEHQENRDRHFRTALRLGMCELMNSISNVQITKFIQSFFPKKVVGSPVSCFMLTTNLHWLIMEKRISPIVHWTIELIIIIIIIWEIAEENGEFYYQINIDWKFML